MLHMLRVTWIQEFSWIWSTTYALLRIGRKNVPVAADDAIEVQKCSKHSSTVADIAEVSELIERFVAEIEILRPQADTDDWNGAKAYSRIKMLEHSRIFLQARLQMLKF